MAKIIQVIREKCAGIDVGSTEVFVGYPNQEVKSFGTTTSEFERLIKDFGEKGIQSVALEATGVYSIVLFDMLRQSGLEVYLVNPKYTKSRAGKKTDVQDSQWIQQLHSVDLLEPSFMPSATILELRNYVRLRERNIADKAKEVNRMSKALIQMNVRLDTVLSQIHGVSGMKMITAILNGERDPENLLMMCDVRIQKNKGEQVVEALKGFYQPQHLFALQQAVNRYGFIENQIVECDAQIEILLNKITKELAVPEELPKAKPIRHNKPKVKNLQLYNFQIFGEKNLTVIPGFTDYTLMRLLGELGSDLSAFPSKKHFTSWLGLAPGKRNSGKSSKRNKYQPKTVAGQIFREMSQSLLASKNHSLGAFGRRIRSKKGPRVAVKALARKLAELYYNAVTKGLDYVEQGVENYQKRYQEQVLKNLIKQAEKHGYQLVTSEHIHG